MIDEEIIGKFPSNTFGDSSGDFYLTGEELADLCTYYINLLGLHGWSITLKMSSGKKMLNNDSADLGNVSYSTVHREATVRLVDFSFYKENLSAYRGEDNIKGYDMEVTLVHELLHIRNILIEYSLDYDSNTLARLNYHGIMHNTAEIIVKLSRSLRNSEKKIKGNDLKK